ncbi:MAG: AAA family ATPase [bacterium]|jgi:ATP-dependent Clp protease ATP-binding subunit ClpB
MSVSLQDYSAETASWLRDSLEFARAQGHELALPVHVLWSALQVKHRAHTLPYLIQSGIDPTPVIPPLQEILDTVPAQESLERAYVSSELKDVLRDAEHRALRSGGLPVVPQSLLEALRHCDSLGHLWPEPAPEDESSPPEESPEEPDLPAMPLPDRLDWVEQARAGQFPDLIGREEELREMVQILCRRSRTNPLLLGPPGVGKTALIQGLACRIAQGGVPELLRTVQIQSLELGSGNLSGSLGELEPRLRQWLRRFPDPQQLILVLEEIHQLPPEIARMLAQLLGTLGVRFVGTSYNPEFSRQVEPNTVLLRQVQVLEVAELDESSTLAILRGMRDHYEAHHGISIRDSALIAAVQLSSKHLQGRHLPDKALDLLDSASTTLRMQLDSLPDEVERREQKLRQLDLEQTSLRKESHPAALQRLGDIQKEWARLMEEATSLRERWQQERQLIQEIKSIRARIEDARVEEREAQQSGNLERAAELHYGTILQLDQELRQASQTFKNREDKLLKEELDEETVAQVIAHHSELSVEQILEDDRALLLQLEAHLRTQVFGQDRALRLIANTLKRNRSGLENAARPAGVFVFAGPAGVGRTEAARSLSEFLFRRPLLRHNLSEFSDAQAAHRLFGGEVGSLTEQVKTQRQGVLLFDELHRAHPEVWQRLAQILQTGRLGMLSGGTCSFQDCILIFSYPIPPVWFEEAADTPLEGRLQQQLQNEFPPDVLADLDEVALFQPLQTPQMRQIVESHLGRIKRQLAQRGVQMSYGETVLLQFAQRGYDPLIGARPLHRMIQREVQDEVATRLLDKSLSPGNQLYLDFVGSAIQFDIR